MSATTLQQLIRTGIRLQREGNLREAKSLYEKALTSSPDNLDALHLYGLACHQLGDHAAAVKYICRAVEKAPNEPVLRNNLGHALYELGSLDEALTQLRSALRLRPNYAAAHQNLGNVCARAGEYEAALEHARAAVRLDSTRPEAWYDLGLILLDQIALEESVKAFRRALAISPTHLAAATSMLYTLNLLPGTDPVEVASEHQRVAAVAFSPAIASPVLPYRNERIRIGYVSGDFRSHAVNFFFQPVLQHHDRRIFEVFCYSNVHEPDTTTQRISQLADCWRHIADWDDAKVVDRIQGDKIDILVDLSGHTKNHRLGVFARKPAQHQVSWLGFPNTTGLEQMDYLVVDPVTAPANENFLCSEAPLRLANGFACFRPPTDAPPLEPAPVSKNRYVTLGCLHKLEKINERVIETWARILGENEGVRLRLIRDQINDWHRKRLKTLFARHGIGQDRLDIVTLTPGKGGFLSAFAQIDILLDTFPWSGHTIACCALWMGVPVISLYGDRIAGRMVASTLKTVGLDELVATDIDGYCGIAAALCADEQRITRYRAELRSRMEQSPLRNEQGFTNDLEAQYLRLLGA